MLYTEVYQPGFDRQGPDVDHFIVAYLSFFLDTYY
jgi:hypothetical protein